MPSPGKASGTGIAAVEAGPSAGPPSRGLQWRARLPRATPSPDRRRERQAEGELLFKTTYPNLHVTAIDISECWDFFLTRKQEQGFKDNYNNSVLAKCNVPSFGGINLLRTLKSRNGTNSTKSQRRACSVMSGGRGAPGLFSRC